MNDYEFNAMIKEAYAYGANVAYQEAGFEPAVAEEGAVKLAASMGGAKDAIVEAFNAGKASVMGAGRAVRGYSDDAVAVGRDLYHRGMGAAEDALSTVPLSATNMGIQGVSPVATASGSLVRAAQNNPYAAAGIATGIGGAAGGGLGYGLS